MEKGENIRSPSIHHEWLHRLNIRETCSKTVRPVPRILLKPLSNHPKQITLGIFMVAPHRTKLGKVFVSQTHLGKDSRDQGWQSVGPCREYALVPIRGSGRVPDNYQEMKWVKVMLYACVFVASNRRSCNLTPPLPQIDP